MRALLLCVLLHPALVRAAADPTDTLVIRLSYTLQRDSNVFRLPAGDSQPFGVARDRRADTIERTGLALRVDKMLGRQRIVAELLVENVGYRANTFLDHAAGNGRASWLWQFGNLWNGEASVTRLRYLASFADIRDNLKSLVDQEQAALTARFRFHPRWNMTGTLEDLNVGNSQPTRQTFDFHSRSGALGLNYVAPADDSAGIRLKFTQGEYPNRAVASGSALPKEYREDEASAILSKTLSGHSSVDGRVGYTERRYTQSPTRNFQGITGRGRFLWTPTGKLSIDTSTWREIRSWEDPTASYVLATGIGFMPTWSVTSKIRLHTDLSYERREFLGDPGLVPGNSLSRDDRVGSARFGAMYSPDRNLELNLAVEQGRRRSTLSSQEYEFRSILASLRASF